MISTLFQCQISDESRISNLLSDGSQLLFQMNLNKLKSNLISFIERNENTNFTIIHTDNDKEPIFALSFLYNTEASKESHVRTYIVYIPNTWDRFFIIEKTRISEKEIYNFNLSKI